MKSVACKHLLWSLRGHSWKNWASNRQLHMGHPRKVEDFVSAKEYAENVGATNDA